MINNEGQITYPGEDFEMNGPAYTTKMLDLLEDLLRINIFVNITNDGEPRKINDFSSMSKTESILLHETCISSYFIRRDELNASGWFVHSEAIRHVKSI